MRLNLPAATALLPLALLGACATHDPGPAPVEGLVYDCRAPDGASAGTARIRFNGQGYQPAGSVMMPGAAPAPRSTATLWFADHRHELMAGWTYLGMRYRSAAPGQGRAIIWAADGEEARILSGVEGHDDETELAHCTRRRQVAGAHAPEAHEGADDTHHR
ncbi:MAG TPA: hypothetical protein VGC46_07735 [Allosphingosinicella sp.]